MRRLALAWSIPGLCLAFATAGCGSSDSNPGIGPGGGDAGGISSEASAEGGANVGTIGPTGGTLSQLVFAVVGDTRPPTSDDLSGYPTAIITRIYEDVEALKPHPPLVVSTGDYQFSSTGSYSTAPQQIQLYMGARAKYSGAWFPAMGNHECTGATASNCGPGTSHGTTANYSAFLKTMLGPVQQTLPYYAIDVNAADGSWTAKFVMTAANAWSSAQQTWLEQTMAKPTTYTFVFRHEPSYDNTAPGVTPIDDVLASSKYTMLIVGHSHTFESTKSTHPVALLGNGGAPLASSAHSYGFGTFVQRADGAIVCDEVDYMTGATDPGFHFVVKADGTLTQ